MLHTLESKQQLKPELSSPLNKLVFVICLLVLIYFAYQRYEQHAIEQSESEALVLAPQVNDIYFLDMRRIQSNLSPNNKYKLAKVIRVGEDNLAVVYGNIFYQWQTAVVNSIEHGDLSNSDYFGSIPDYIPLNKIKEMQSNDTIYLIKRPVQNMLYGNFISPEKV